MTITRMYEVVCDYCGCAEHGFFNQADTEREFREYGGIITARGEHFCSKECYRKHQDSAENDKILVAEYWRHQVAVARSRGLTCRD